MAVAPFVILLGGPLEITSSLQQKVQGLRCIAADGGMRHAPGLGITPELWVGDFDSSSPALLAQFPKVPRQTHPMAKDQTDGELAVQEALKRGAQHLWLLGALGHETDKTLQHLMLAIQVAQKGVGVWLCNGPEEAWPLLPGQLQLHPPTGSTLSMVGFTPLQGLSLTGVRWPLTAQDIPLGSSLTLSNQTTGSVQITLRAGYGVVMLLRNESKV